MARSPQRDFYEVLNVKREATIEEIKSSCRQSALKWHPDRNPVNKEEADVLFRECTEAYSVLSDPQKRQIYDQYGHAGLSSAGGTGGFDGRVFQDLFGGRRGGGRNRAQRGADLRYDMPLTFEEAAAGVTTKVRLPRQEYCE